MKDKVKDVINYFLDDVIANIENDKVKSVGINKLKDKEIKVEKISNFLNKSASNIPEDGSGVYFIVSLESIENNIKSDFSEFIKNNVNEIELKKYNKNKLEIKYDKVLNNKKNNHKEVLYIGKAEGNNNLRGRINQYMSLQKNHSGGRAIWQIEGIENFYICWIKTNNASNIETTLIQAYSDLIKKNPKDKDNYYPFANWRK